MTRQDVRAAAGGPDTRVGAIWAQDRDGALGADRRMLWQVPADFRHFKDSTVGGVLIMGHTTWESIGGVLPGRVCVVMTRRHREISTGGTITAGSLGEALRVAGELVEGLGEDPRTDGYRGGPRRWVIGGGTVFRQAMDQDVLDELVVSTIDLHAAQYVTQPGVQVVCAPRIDDKVWARRQPLSDEPGRWRPVSGDAAWRVDYWSRRR